MPGQKYIVAYEAAVDSFGYLTVEAAREVGVSPAALHAMARRGVLQHVSTGVYRVNAFPPTPRSEYMEASLWPRGVPGVISHESALVLHELSDVNPGSIHITVPRAHRSAREPPAMYVIHRADLPPGDVGDVEGIPVTTPTRTILDVHAAHLGPDLVRQAIRDAVRKGLISRAAARRLRKRCLGPGKGQ